MNTYKEIGVNSEYYYSKLAYNGILLVASGIFTMGLYWYYYFWATFNLHYKYKKMIYETIK